MKKQQHYKAALYCRLSVDDGNFGGSVSIETQKILLEQYCKDHKITDYKFYCDDGCSGTNFDRQNQSCYRQRPFSVWTKLCRGRYVCSTVYRQQYPIYCGGR